MKASTKKNLAAVGIILLTILICLIVALNYYSSVRIAPNVTIGNLSISNKNVSDAKEQVTQELSVFKNSPVNFVINDTEVQTDLQSLGIKIDEEKTMNVIEGLGQGQNYWRRLIFLLQSPFVTVRISPQYSFDIARFTEAISTIFSQFETKPQDAAIVYKGGRFEVQEDHTGVLINQAKLAHDLKENISKLSQAPITVELIASEPSIKAHQLQFALAQISEIAKNNITLTYGNRKWEISGKNLVDMIELLQEDQIHLTDAKISIISDTFVIKTARLADDQKSDLKVTVSPKKIGNFVEDIASAVDTKTVDAKLRFEGEKVVEFTAAQDGQELDVRETTRLVNESLARSEKDSTKATVIKLPVQVTKAKVEGSGASELGIKELVGRGVSYFAGSIANRVHNISLGSSRISGTLVAPQEVFSFNKSVGEVSAATGYRQAYVISSGKTVLDDGGGICQVSTTVFRAALDAGLPIVKRTAHSYRVGYYEQGGYKAGIDATVFAPAVDFQFKNDTDHYILVQTIVDRANAKLQIDLYGTADGRKVEISTPVVSNIVPAPPDRYQDDPTLPKGTTKQVDFSAQGATAVFGRKVYKGDKLLIDDVFKSNYRPWQAVFLVGTG